MKVYDSVKNIKKIMIEINKKENKKGGMSFYSLTPIVFKVYISYIKSGFFYILILYI
jgi:hypothetical protein